MIATTNPAHDTGSPAMAGQTYEPPVQHLAAPFICRETVGAAAGFGILTPSRKSVPGSGQRKLSPRGRFAIKYTMNTKQKIKILSDSLSIFTLVIVFLLPLHIVHADTCVPPTPPTCYSTQTSQEPVGQLPDGSIVIQTSQQPVEVNCKGTQKEIDYEVQLDSYNVCQEINAIHQEASSPSNVSELLGSSSADNLDCMKMGAWYAYDENSKTCIDTQTSELNPTCNSYYGTNSYYNESDQKCECKSGFSLNLDAAGTKLTCEAPSVSNVSSLTCPANASLGGDQLCRCDAGFGVGSGIDSNKCIPRDRALSESCATLYGPQTYYNQTIEKCECNAGYVFDNGSNDQTNRCVPQDGPDQKESGPTPFTSTSTTTTLKTPVHVSPQVFATSDAEEVAATSMQNVIYVQSSTSASVPVTAAKQMRWYDWLNPLNWFSWLRS
jgi:hypothetical protein